MPGAAEPLLRWTSKGNTSKAYLADLLVGQVTVSANLWDPKASVDYSLSSMFLEKSLKCDTLEKAMEKLETLTETFVMKVYDVAIKGRNHGN